METRPYNGPSSYGCAITPLSLRDISPNRGITPPYMHTIDFVRRGDSRIARKA